MSQLPLNKDEQEAEVFEPYGLQWVNTSIYDDDTYGAGHWTNGIHKIVPLFFDGYCEYDIYEVVGITNIDELSGMADGVQHGEPKLIYSASIDLNDKDYVYKLFVNLGLVVEPDFDDDDFEPVI
jgi:hypothetical protein